MRYNKSFKNFLESRIVPIHSESDYYYNLSKKILDVIWRTKFGQMNDPSINEKFGVVFEF